LCAKAENWCHELCGELETKLGQGAAKFRELLSSASAKLTTQQEAAAAAKWASASQETKFEALKMLNQQMKENFQLSCFGKCTLLIILLRCRCKARPRS